MDKLTQAKLIRDDITAQRDAEAKKLDVLKQRYEYLKSVPLSDFVPLTPYRPYESDNKYVETVRENTLASIESDIAYLEERVRNFSYGVEDAIEQVHKFENEGRADKEDSE